MATVYSITIEDVTEEPHETVVFRVGRNDGGTYDVDGELRSGEDGERNTIVAGIESLDDAIAVAQQVLVNVLTADEEAE